jgi:hypothetical protein
VANLAFGILGVLCLGNRNGFWTATAIGWSTFMVGAAVVHLRQIRLGHPAQKSALNCYQNNSPELPAS